MVCLWPSTKRNKKPSKKSTASKANLPVVGEKSENTSTKGSSSNLITQVKNPGNLKSDLTQTPTKD